jgi:quinoprotein glucose dehydrogenase
MAVAVLAVAGSRVAPAAAQQPTRSTWDGVYTADQAQRGGALYQETCSQCHGPQLGGIDAAPPLVGGRFASNWNGINLGDMVQRIRISMPQDNPGSLSRNQVADVLAYILQANGFPTGEKDLPRQTSFLKMIAYEAYKPGA